MTSPKTTKYGVSTSLKPLFRTKSFLESSGCRTHPLKTSGYWPRSNGWKSKGPVLFEMMVQIKTKVGHGVETPPPRSLWCGVLLPSFSNMLKSMDKRTLVSGASNTLTVTLTVNYDLADRSTVTISGLTASATIDWYLTVTSIRTRLGWGLWTRWRRGGRRCWQRH